MIKQNKRTLLTEKSAHHHRNFYHLCLLLIVGLKLMKQFSITLIFASLSVTASAVPTTVKALRINETHPTTTAYVLSTQEQLSGQSFQQDAMFQIQCLDCC